MGKRKNKIMRISENKLIKYLHLYMNKIYLYMIFFYLIFILQKKKLKLVREKNKNIN